MTCAHSHLGANGVLHEPSAGKPVLVRDSLSPAAQQRLAELIEQLNPLGAMVARAKSKRAERLCGAVGDHKSECKSTSSVIGKNTSLRSKRRRGASGRDIRLPPIGSVVQRIYKGHDIVARVLDSGFEYEGKRYRSLSAIAKQVTGAHWNGMLFFGLVRQEK